MSTKDPNMKVIFGSDTKDFEKGAQTVKQGLKDLDKGSTSMLASLSSAFGVPAAKVEQMTSAVRGLGYKLVETGNKGAQALGSVLAKIGPLQAGIAGLGLAGAIAGFKQLKAEADNFKSTIDGMNISMATSAYISTYKQVLHDVNSDTGKAVAEGMAQWEKGLGRFKANIQATLGTAMGDSRWYDAISPAGLIRAWGKVRPAIDEATAAAERNEKRGSELADIMRDELQVRREVADLEVKIAQQRRILRDRTADVTERAEAEARVRELIQTRSEKQTSIAERLYEVTQAMTDEAGSTKEEIEKAVSLYEQWQGKIAATENEMATVDRYASSIAGSSSAAAEAARKQREEMAAMAAVQAKWSGIGQLSALGPAPSFPGVTAPVETIVPTEHSVDTFQVVFSQYLAGMTFGVAIEPKKESIVDFSSELENGLVNMAGRTSEIMGNLIGTLASGGDAWGDFKDAALSSLGDMAIAVGKIAIKTGVGMLGIQAALKLDNPYVAIAAGAALVALGAAVKSSLSAVASGDYSAGGGGYSPSSSSGGGGDWEAREVNVNVSGTLTANGDQLQAVLNNTKRKNYYTQ